MKRIEIDFMNYYVALLSKYGESSIDISDNLKEYMIELEKVMRYRNILDKDSSLNDIFNNDNISNTYDEFINLVLYVTASPKYSKLDEKEGKIKLNLDHEEINKMLNKSSLIELDKVEEVVLYMNNYSNLKSKVKKINR